MKKANIILEEKLKNINNEFLNVFYEKNKDLLINIIKDIQKDAIESTIKKCIKNTKMCLVEKFPDEQHGRVINVCENELQTTHLSEKDMYYSIYQKSIRDIETNMIKDL